MPHCPLPKYAPAKISIHIKINMQFWQMSKAKLTAPLQIHEIKLVTLKLTNKLL